MIKTKVIIKVGMAHSIHNMVVGHGSNDHKGASYKFMVMEIGCIITRTQ